MKGVGERHRTPFFNALREYAKQPTGVFHALPLARGKSIMNSNWIGDLAQFYGMNLFMAETSATSGGLDSLLDPVGPLKVAQEYAARAFGAKRTYFATNGTSTCNKIVVQALVRPDDIVLVDRNCHKSHHYGMVLAGAQVDLPRLVPARPVLDVRRGAGAPHQADAARLPQGRHAEPRAHGAADQLHLRRRGLRRRARDDGVPGDQARPGVPVGRGLVRVRALPPDLPPAHRHGDRREARRPVRRPGVREALRRVQGRLRRRGLGRRRARAEHPPAARPERRRACASTPRTRPTRR